MARVNDDSMGLWETWVVDGGWQTALEVENWFVLASLPRDPSMGMVRFEFPLLPKKKLRGYPVTRHPVE